MFTLEEYKQNWRAMGHSHVLNNWRKSNEFIKASKKEISKHSILSADVHAFQEDEQGRWIWLATFRSDEHTLVKISLMEITDLNVLLKILSSYGGVTVERMLKDTSFAQLIFYKMRTKELEARDAAQKIFQEIKAQRRRDAPAKAAASAHSQKLNEILAKLLGKGKPNTYNREGSS